MQMVRPIWMLVIPLVCLVYFSIQLWSNDSLEASNGEQSEVTNDDTLALHTREFLSANGTCLSFQGERSYRPNITPEPSYALVGALRLYEEMHRKCVTGVSDWPAHLQQSEKGLESCSYLVWKDVEAGIGNRFSSLLSAFEYALVTNRAVLVDTLRGMDQLLCNFIEGSSIWLPVVLRDIQIFNSPELQLLIKGQDGDKAPDRINSVVVMVNNRPADRNWIWCSKVQEALKQVPWIVWDSNQYNSPGMFLVPAFEERLKELFPEGLMTSLTARYILHPVDAIWERVSQAYKAFLQDGSKRVGLQIRTRSRYDPKVFERIVECMSENNVLEDSTSSEQTNETTVILVASLDHQYYESFKERYEVANGGRLGFNKGGISVYTASPVGEETYTMRETQQAMVEIWLLAFTDVLLISYHSTLGYIPSALRGELPVYHMNIKELDWTWNGQPVCKKGRSSNACYHRWPEALQCPGEPSKAPPNMTHIVAACSDVEYGRQVLQVDAEAQ